MTVHSVGVGPGQAGTLLRQEVAPQERDPSTHDVEGHLQAAPARIGGLAASRPPDERLGESGLEVLREVFRILRLGEVVASLRAEDAFGSDMTPGLSPGPPGPSPATLSAPGVLR